MQTSGEIRREIAKPYPRHCEPPGRREAPPDDRLREAIHWHLMRGKMDCFASLAMTRRDRNALRQRGEGCQPVACSMVLKVLTYIS
jgi:hypothetical protein